MFGEAGLSHSVAKLNEYAKSKGRAKEVRQRKGYV